MVCIGALNALLSSIQVTSLVSDGVNEWANAVQLLQLVASGISIILAVSECILVFAKLQHRRALLVSDVVSKAEVDADAFRDPRITTDVLSLSLSRFNEFGPDDFWTFRHTADPRPPTRGELPRSFGHKYHDRGHVVHRQLATSNPTLVVWSALQLRERITNRSPHKRFLDRYLGS